MNSMVSSPLALGGAEEATRAVVVGASKDAGSATAALDKLLRSAVVALAQFLPPETEPEESIELLAGPVAHRAVVVSIDGAHDTAAHTAVFEDAGVSEAAEAAEEDWEDDEGEDQSGDSRGAGLESPEEDVGAPTGSLEQGDHEPDYPPHFVHGLPLSFFTQNHISVPKHLRREPRNVHARLRAGMWKQKVRCLPTVYEDLVM